jgi:hypothetical protein
MKQVKCKSGLTGWQCRLRKNYNNSFEQFKAYAEMYGLHTRLGFKTIVGAWKSNPVIRGSVIPSDFQRVS